MRVGLWLGLVFLFAVVDGLAMTLCSGSSSAGVKSLLALSACTPLVARVHHGMWGRVVSPLQPAA